MFRRLSKIWRIFGIFGATLFIVFLADFYVVYSSGFSAPTGEYTRPLHNKGGVSYVLPKSARRLDIEFNTVFLLFVLCFLFLGLSYAINSAHRGKDVPSN